ncbi:ABC transporter ATP-binding protein [Nocardia sp. NPDC020380]|uniref:ABC transporter ATP-binding protein n=1 Tax=Nocardia sp. NPDC020380 TaxID=3364309 RepID=UPI003789A2AE
MIDAMAPAVVDCRGVGRRYGRGRAAVSALCEIDCQVREGDRIAVTGRSGSGKSTLLHLMGGLDTPSTGTVSWPALGGSPDRPGAIGFVFQAPSLIPPLDAVENVALPLVIAGMTESEARARAMDALSALGITDLADRLPGELSGGQAQRVAVARVLAARVRLVLADEPTARLDPVHRDQVIETLLAISVHSGAAVVVSTHDTAVAARFERRWRLDDGRLIEDATTSPVRQEDPAC